MKSVPVRTGLKMCRLSSHLQTFSFLKSASCCTCSSLWRLERNCQSWMVWLYSAVAVPAWRALIFPCASSCTLKASRTIITISCHGSRGIRNGLFTKANWVLLGEQSNFKVQEKDMLAMPWTAPVLLPMVLYGYLQSWSFRLVTGILKVKTLFCFHLTRRYQVYMWAKISLEGLQPATCRCIFFGFLDPSPADCMCAAFRIQMTLKR